MPRSAMALSSRSSSSTASDESAISGFKVNPAHRAVLAFEIDLIRIVGINNRDLTTLRVDLQTSANIKVSDDVDDLFAELFEGRGAI